MPVSRASASVLAIVALLALLVASYAALWWRGPDALVVYCAHDAVFADAILQDFTRRTGIPVAVRYDTEATKSLGLVERITQESAHPSCDVFWNNELLGTADLADRGLLEPYLGSGWRRMPKDTKDPGGTWTGFAARMRVMLVNTSALKADDQEIAQRLAGDLSRVAIAKPLYGTTLTHYTALAHVLGDDGVKAWHRDCRARGIRETDGNGMVKSLVADGACDLGFTDTDDAFGAIDEGKPVAMRPARLPDGSTIVIPNTVAVVRGCPHAAQAHALVDWLLSSECELALARSASRQIPIGPLEPVEEARLPEQVRELREWSGHALPLAGLLGERRRCLAWLQSEYAP